MRSYADDLKIGFPTNSILQPFELIRPSRHRWSQNQTLSRIKQDVYLCRIQANYGYHTKQNFDIDSIYDKKRI